MYESNVYAYVHFVYNLQLRRLILRQDRNGIAVILLTHMVLVRCNISIRAIKCRELKLHHHVESRAIAEKFALGAHTHIHICIHIREIR